ncbi:hypothetical protein ZWY2020_009614 [Hordeum vulgare]|nr:hypothetical protein ZWY2020_009614 [Hordeum vulgare]
MDTLVNVHYLDMETFMKGNDDEVEESMVFESNPTYEDLVVKVRFTWIDPNVDVKLIGRYDVGVGVKSRLKSMPITSKLHWKVYMDKVVESQDKSLELFATKVEPPLLQIDLNRHASSPIHAERVAVYVPRSSSQPPNEAEMNYRAMVIHEEEVNVRANNARVDRVDAHVHDEDIAHVDIYEESKEIRYNPLETLPFQN